MGRTGTGRGRKEASVTWSWRTQQVARSLLRHGQLWSDGHSELTVQLAKPKWDRQHHTVDAIRPGE